jgi:hypothetical protein
MEIEMNERIKELEKQSVFYNENEEIWETDLEKFAELIVRECIAQCDEENSQKYIMQHFGVEI